MLGEADRLAGVGHFRFEESVEALVDLVRHRIEHVAALGRRELAPRAVERRPRGAHGGIDVGRAGLRHAGDQRAVDRRALVEALAACGCAILAGDKIANILERSF